MTRKEALACVFMATLAVTYPYGTVTAGSAQRQRETASAPIRVVSEGALLKVERDGGYPSLKKGDELRWNEVVQSSNEVTLELPSIGRVTMGPHAILRLVHTAEGTRIDLVGGRVDIALLPQRALPFAVRTPNARIRATSTVFATVFLPRRAPGSTVTFNETSPGTTQVHVREGVVEAIAWTATGAAQTAVRLFPNNQIIIDPNGAPHFYEGVPPAQFTSDLPAYTPPLLGPTDGQQMEGDNAGGFPTALAVTSIGASVAGIALAKKLAEQQQEQQGSCGSNCGSPPPPPSAISNPSSVWLPKAREWCRCMCYQPGQSMGGGLQCPQ